MIATRKGGLDVDTFWRFKEAVNEDETVEAVEGGTGEREREDDEDVIICS